MTTLERVNELLVAMEIVAEYERGLANDKIEQSLQTCIELCTCYDMYIVADQYRDRLKQFYAGVLRGWEQVHDWK